jgi:hypothetical protein
MKVIKISIPYDWNDIDSENDNIDVSVNTDDGYNYVLSVATPKNIQFLMDKEGKEYYGSGYPFIIVNKLTPEIIEQAVKAFAEKNNGYWLKTYHFAGWQGAIDESIFDQLKAKQTKRLKNVDELDGL